MRISCSSSVLQIVTDIAVAISPTCSQECLVSDLHLEQRYMTSVSDLAHFCFQAFQNILAPFDCACPNFGADSSHKLFYINCFPGISVHHILQNYTGLPDWPDLRRDQGLLSFAKNMYSRTDGAAPSPHGRLYSAHARQVTQCECIQHIQAHTFTHTAAITQLA